MKIKGSSIIYLPGWLDRTEIHGFTPGLDIWGSQVSEKEKINYDYVIGYSLGANFALANWSFHKNTKLILLNPLIVKETVGTLFFRFLKYSFTEGIFGFHSRRMPLYLLHTTKAIKKCRELLRYDYVEILKKIPKEDIMIIRGKWDKYLCNDKNKELIQALGVNLIEISDLGHNWDNKMDKVIRDILSKSNDKLR